MAWRISTTMHDEFRPSVTLHPDDEALYDRMIEDVKREQNLYGLTAIAMNAGFKFPQPDHPFRLQITSDHETLPPFLAARISWAVPQSVIDAIESLEPGVHRYWPVDITMKDGSKAEPRWLLNICNRLDTISREHSNVGEVGTDPKFSILVMRPDGPKRIVSHREKVGQHALWCEYKYQVAIVISNELAELFREIGTEGLDFEMEIEEI